jgi:glutamate-1-semialdehyde 2,1-aminomutase
MRKLTRSNEHFKKALSKLPLGVASNFRYWGDEQTIYVDHGKGGRMWDIDGNEYIDYRLGYGPIILGYADERVSVASLPWPPSENTKSQPASARWCRPPSSYASPTREPRP